MRDLPVAFSYTPQDALVGSLLRPDGAFDDATQIATFSGADGYRRHVLRRAPRDVISHMGRNLTLTRQSLLMILEKTLDLLLKLASNISLVPMLMRLEGLNRPF